MVEAISSLDIISFDPFIDGINGVQLAYANKNIFSCSISLKNAKYLNYLPLSEMYLLEGRL